MHNVCIIVTCLLVVEHQMYKNKAKSFKGTQTHPCLQLLHSLATSKILWLGAANTTNQHL